MSGPGLHTEMYVNMSFQGWGGIESGQEPHWGGLQTVVVGPEREQTAPGSSQTALRSWASTCPPLESD